MTILSIFRKDQRGLTLVELMASMVLFALVTLGITPLLLSSVRGAGLSRTYTIGKNLAVQGMERIRGLQYFVSYASQNKAVDVLDLYFPRASGAGYDVTNGTYTTVCTSSTTASASCPDELPDGYSVTYVAQFVRASNAEVEEYSSVPADELTNYAWDGQDTPPSRILRMSVTASWTFGARTPSHRLTSIVGDRRIIADKISGQARTDYVVQVLASYVNGSEVSDLKFRAGISDSQIESRLLSSAALSTSAGDARLTKPSTTEGAEAEELGRFVGASSILRAPPNVDSGTPVDLGSVGLEHPQLGRVAGFASTRTYDLKARIVDENPESSGSFGWNTASDGQIDAWVNNQASFGTETQLKLNNAPLASGADSIPAILNLTKRSGKSVAGLTDAYTGALGGTDRRVRTKAQGSFGQLNLFPVSFIGGSNPSQRSVIQIRDFTSEVLCDSTASGTAQATATYSAQVAYWGVNSWSPTNQYGGVLGDTAAGHKTTAHDGTSLLLSSSNTEDVLKKLGPEPTKNPMVWRDPLSTQSVGSPLDIYLFPITHQHGLVTHNHPGYLDPAAPWDSVFNTAASTEKTPDGRNTSARLSGAIRITTVRLNPSIPESGMNITIGSLACDASDLR